MKYFFYLSILISFFFYSSCTPKTSNIIPPITNFYQEEIKLWQASRFQEITAPDGWLSLIGLYWLKEGESTFGKSKLNTIPFPKGTPNYIGRFILENDSVHMKIDELANVKIGETFPKMTYLQADKMGAPTIASLGNLSWYLLQRENRFGIRLRDAKNSAIRKFKGIEHFPISQDWQIPATLRLSKTEKSITLRNVVDMDVNMKLEGYLIFEIAGVTYELEALDGGADSYFIIFADETTGVETYGAGRYLYVPRADDAGNTLIDFNKAHNPPCAFTDFATCPLPSGKNTLDVSILAGEKNYQK